MSIMDTIELRLNELRKELVELLLSKHEYERKIICIQKQIDELEKLLCNGHIWKLDKYDLYYCSLCYKYKTPEHS